MRGIIGYSVLVIGLAVAAQTFLPGAVPLRFSLSKAPAISVPEKAAGAIDVVEARDIDRLTGFSPGRQLVDAARESRANRIDIMAFVTSQLGIAPATATTSPSPPPRDVALEPWRTAVEPAVEKTLASEAETWPQTEIIKRVALIREIQRELTRVGCYDGRIDGSWGPASKRAMVAFVQRVNASLPLNEPDNILLLLVKGQAEGTCADACPLGQSLSRDHRCVPDAILAYADKRPRGRSSEPAQRVAEASSISSPTTSIWTPATSARDWRLDGRMGIGAPPADENVTEAASPVVPARVAAVEATGAQPASPTAIIENSAANDGAGMGELGLAPPPPLTDAARPAQAKPRAASARRTRYTERRERRGPTNSVQQLFLHPLGRL